MSAATVGKWAGRVISAASTILVVVVGITGGLYLKEKSQPATDYYEYYGNVTTKSTFTYPEQISSYTFGKSDGPIVLDFVNQLWCSPIDSGMTPALIATRLKHFDTFTFSNILPGIVVKAVSQHKNISQIGVIDQQNIRKSDTTNFLSWTMDDIRPETSSDCYISAEVTGYSEIFNLPKVIYFDGNGFEYIVPE